MEYTDIDNLLSESAKENKDYLMKMTDHIISSLVVEKADVAKQYNYYNGIMDEKQLQHLKEQYGLGAPTSLEFIPLVRPHIDQLVGELLEIPFNPQVTCKDKKTLSAINRDKQVKIQNKLFTNLSSKLNAEVSALLANDNNKQAVVDPYIREKLEDLKNDLTQDFISEYEEAITYLLTYLKQDHNVQLINKRKELFLALAIAGECYFETNTDLEEQLPELDVIHPLNAFVEFNPNSPHINRSTKAVVRKFLSRQEILMRYGHLMKPEDINKLQSKEAFLQENKPTYITHTGDSGIIAGVSAGLELTQLNDWQRWFYHDRRPVYEVQFLAANEYEDSTGKKRYRLDRYETVRLGTDIYILKGKADNVFRAENSNDQRLTIGGIRYAANEGKPYSLVLATANLQDRYNILHFYRDTLIQLSGVKGSAIETSVIPTWLGSTPEERFLKYIAYKKQGNAPLNTAQEGQSTMNTQIFQPYDDSVSGPAIQALNAAIMQTEESCSRITGVFRERLGGIQSYDAVSNVKVGLRQSAVVTKQYYQTLDFLTKELLINLIDSCRITLKKGFTGQIILGKLSFIFEVKPEHLSFTSYDIHIDDSGEQIKNIQKIEELTLELIKGGIIDQEVLVSVIGVQSLTQLKHALLIAIKQKREENDLLGKLQQQMVEAEKMVKELQAQNQALMKENEGLKGQAIEIQKYKIDKDFELGIIRDKTQKDFNTKRIELDLKRVRLEQLQLIDNNSQNDEIKNHS